MMEDNYYAERRTPPSNWTAEEITIAQTLACSEMLLHMREWFDRKLEEQAIVEMLRQKPSLPPLETVVSTPLFGAHVTQYYPPHPEVYQAKLLADTAKNEERRAARAARREKREFRKLGLPDN